MLEVKTDKVNGEIEARENGILDGIRALEGQGVQFNSVVAIIKRED